MVAGFMASLNVTLTAALGQAAALPATGTKAVTRGAGAQEFAAVEMVPVYVTPGLRKTAGVKLAVLVAAL
jgi:hypothetical protein